MGIIDDYFKTSTEDTSTDTSPKSSSVINQYMSDTARPRVYIQTPKPPISDATPEQSAAINAQTPIQGGENPREGISSIPMNAIGATYDAAKSGVLQAGSGIGDILTNNPATGFGKIGSGLASVAASPVAGIEQLTGDVTGSKDIADRAGLVASAVPVTAMTSAFKTGLNATTGVQSAGEAFRKLVEDIGPSNATKVAKEMEANPRITPADLSPSVRQGVQRLYANVEGPHVNHIGSVVDQRLKTAAADLEQHMNANLGSAVDPVKKLEELKQNIRNIGTTKISPAIANSKPVDLSSTVAKIDEVLNPGVSSAISNDTILADPELEGTLKSLRKYLTDDKSVRVDPEQLNRLQSAFRKKAENLQSTKPELAKAIFQVRNNMVDAIDKASGGKYKPALNNYRDEYHIQDAFEHGHDAIIKNSKALGDRPEYFEKWVKDAKPEEVQAAKEGARIAYDTQMNAFKHAARRGTDIGDVEFNKRRMTALFGEAEADKMFKTFEDAKKIADTNNKLVQGSQSRIQNAQNTYFEPHNPSKASNPLSTAVNVGLPIAGEIGSQFLGGPGGVGAGATIAGLTALKVGAHYAGKAKDSIIKKLEDERNLSYSKYALPTQGPDRDQLIQALKVVGNQTPRLSNRSKLRMLVSP